MENIKAISYELEKAINKIKNKILAKRVYINKEHKKNEIIYTIFKNGIQENTKISFSKQTQKYYPFNENCELGSMFGKYETTSLKEALKQI